MNKLLITFILDLRRFQMKVLKIVLILLIPAMGIVGCRKSGCKPENHATTETTDQTTVPDDSGNLNSRPADEIEETDKGTTVVGSGDDDRDGGDKRQKKSAAK